MSVCAYQCLCDVIFLSPLRHAFNLPVIFLYHDNHAIRRRILVSSLFLVILRFCLTANKPIMTVSRLITSALELMFSAFSKDTTQCTGEV